MSFGDSVPTGIPVAARDFWSPATLTMAIDPAVTV
jgi:hypothetical protein